MKRAVVLFALLIATPAAAAHCPHGQLLRVHLGRCVRLGSPLALAYEGRPKLRRIHVALPRPAPPFDDKARLDAAARLTPPGPDAFWPALTPCCGKGD